MKTSIILICSLFVLNAFAEIKNAAGDIIPLSVGFTLPDGSVTRLDGTETTLSEEIDGQPSVLVFYRGGWCMYCMRHLSALKRVVPQLKELGYKVIAISPDYLENAKEAADENEIDYTILVDSKLELIQSFNLSFKLDGATVEKFAEYEIEVRPLPDTEIHILPVPAVYVVDAGGMIRYLYCDSDYTKRIDPEVLLNEAKAVKNK